MKIMAALSGGVDSAVAALLLKQQGYDVRGAYMKTWMNEDASSFAGDCPWHQDILDAEACAKKIGIEFEVVDFIKEYHEQIVEYMVEGYKRGQTPNPDVMCNRRMKFGKFLDFAKTRGCGVVATGHYCASVENFDGTKDLVMGADPSKDQSYFLAMITKAQLAAASFPIGSLLKSEVREIAKMNGLPNCDKKDSQGICFLGKIKIQDFLRQFIEEKPGDIVNAQGKKVGRHKGLFNYTIGQRKGIGVPSNADNKNYVVVAKDFENNILKVDFDSPAQPDLWKSRVEVEGLNWINRELDKETEILARVRYRDGLVKSRFIPLDGGGAIVEFAEPQRAIASGQVLALYSGNVLLGGAIYK
ncbi:MAG: tRNA 2-thiouridine(34) synthase MnmA [Opitutales bacterium]|nr:tRNA 2-thiouridine(34) synthase MnmA [Opitutales bacterium]